MGLCSACKLPEGRGCACLSHLFVHSLIQPLFNEHLPCARPFSMLWGYQRGRIPDGFPGGASGKEPTCQCRRHGFDPWVGRIPWRRAWQPTVVFLPGESHRQRSLVGYSPWSSKELDKAEHTHTHRGQPIANQ